MRLNRTLYSTLFLFLFINKSFCQKFFDTNFNSEQYYKQKDIKEEKINILEIYEYKATFASELADALAKKNYYNYYLEFNKNGDIIKNMQYMVIDSIKNLRYKDIYNYNNKRQLIRKEYYDSNDSLYKISSYTYLGDKLKTAIEQNKYQDTTNQIIYEYNKTLQHKYTIQHDFLNGIHRLYLFEKPSETTEKKYTYNLDDSTTVKINDSIITKSHMVSYSITSFNNEGKKINTLEYDKDNSLISENLYTEIGELDVTDNKYYSFDNQIENRNKYLIDKNGYIIETHNLVRNWIAGKVTFDMVKTSYAYDSNFDVIKKIQEKDIETNYKIEKDKKQNWILIQEFDSDYQFKNVYVRKIKYY